MTGSEQAVFYRLRMYLSTARNDVATTRDVFLFKRPDSNYAKGPFMHQPSFPSDDHVSHVNFKGGVLVEFQINGRSDICTVLADRAWKRFESRRAVEWRTALALWSAFGVTSTAIITTESFQPEWIAATIVTVISVLLIVYLWAYWFPYLRKSLYRDLATTYYWETVLQQELGDHRLPAFLRPESSGLDFPTVYDPDGRG